MSVIPETIIRALCWTLLHSLWQGLILAVLAGLVMLLTKRARSSVRYTLLAAMMLGFLVISGATFVREMRVDVAGANRIGVVGQAGGAANLSGPADGNGGVRQGSDANGVDGVAGSRVGGEGGRGVGSEGGSRVGGEGGRGAGDGARNRVGVVGQLVQYFNTHASVVVVVWFIVFLGRLVNLLSGLVYAQRIRYYQVSPIPAEWQERLKLLLARLKIARPVKMLESALIKVPVVVGWLKPVILVPVGMLANLSAQQVESILLHELAHISRKDYVFNLVQHLVDTLFFFNPALLWVSALIRTERENCCDDVAIRETRSRRRLIEALVSFHDYQQGARGYVGPGGQGYAMGFGGKDNQMLKRVERIVYKKNHSLNVGERVLMMGSLVLLCGAWITISSSTAAGPETVTVKRTEVVKKTAVEKAVDRAETTQVVKMTDKAENTEVVKRTGRAETTEVARNASGRKPAVSRPVVAAVANDTTKPKDTVLTHEDVEVLIRAREHGVTPEYISELKMLGYMVSLEKAITLVDHGVSDGFLRSIREEGYGKISLEMAVRLVDHGVNAEFIHRVKAVGFPNLTLEQAVTLVDHGVNAGFIEKWKQKTESKLDFNDYIRLKDAGIDPS
jgi:bla regulator protein BlaR1